MLFSLQNFFSYLPLAIAQTRNLVVTLEYSLSHPTSKCQQMPSAQPSEIHPTLSQDPALCYHLSHGQFRQHLAGTPWGPLATSIQEPTWPLSKAKHDVYTTVFISQNSLPVYRTVHRKRVWFTICKLCVNVKKMEQKTKTDHITPPQKPVQWLSAHSLQWSVRPLISVLQVVAMTP